MLRKLLEHPHVVESAKKLKAAKVVVIQPPTPSGNIDDEPSEETHPADSRFVYVFQKEYATVDPATVQVDSCTPAASSAAHSTFIPAVESRILLIHSPGAACSIRCWLILCLAHVSSLRHCSWWGLMR